MHRQLRQLLAIRLKKKKEASWVRDALRFLGTRSCFEGQSNGVKSPCVATRNVTKPWKRAGRASASHFPSPDPSTVPSSLSIFRDFRLSKSRVFPLLGLSTSKSGCFFPSRCVTRFTQHPARSIWRTLTRVSSYDDLGVSLHFAMSRFSLLKFLFLTWTSSIIESFYFKDNRTWICII